MAQLITSMERVRLWAPAKSDDNTGLVEACLQAASDFVEDYTGARWVSPPTAEVQLYDGSGDAVRGRQRDILQLRSRPILQLVGITENGVALTFAAGYSTSADVIYTPETAKLYRRQTSTPQPVDPVRNDSGWQPGRQNIAITVRTGYEIEDVPEDLVQACVEVTWAIFKLSSNRGTVSISRGGNSKTITNELSPVAQRTLDQRRDWAMSL